jgi:hypothetical protein
LRADAHHLKGVKALEGQEDIFPVAIRAVGRHDPCSTRMPFVAVARARGQQLKEVAQLDGWLRDGSAAYVEALCEWE